MNHEKALREFPDYTITKDGLIKNKHGKLISPYLSSGYFMVGLTNAEGKRKNTGIHRLMADTFIEPIPEGMWVNHIDGDKQNNQLSNLEIATPSHNATHAWKTGLTKGRTDSDRREAIVVLTVAGWSQRRLAKLFGTSQPNIAEMLKKAKK